MKERTLATLLLRFSFLLALAALLALVMLGCAASHHPTVAARLGGPGSSEAMLELIDRPGPIAMEKVLAATWVVARSGLIHLDHIMGLPDIAKDTPVYAGPGETRASFFMNLFTRGSTDRLFGGLGSLREWPFEPDPANRFAGVLDVFGDGSLWALHVPGHTPGSTAFLVRTPEGSRLLIGDATHTRWGWEHGVEPGTFSLDQEQSAVSLMRLKDLAKQFPQLPVHPGHQSLSAERARRD